MLAIRATFGVLVSRDSGKTWDWICEKAMGYGGSIEDPSIALTSGPGLLVGTQEGLATSADACSWTLFPSLGSPILDLVVKKDDSKAAIALVAVAGKVDDAGNATYQNILYVTKDSGVTWAPLGAPIDPLLLVQTVEVAKSDAHRIYVSGTSYRANGADAVILMSTDDGAHFARHTFPLADNEVAPFISAVDPTNADRVYIRVQSSGGSRLVVSDDGGVTFKDKFTTTGPMLGFALSEDGSKVYLGGIEDGLFEASRTDLVFTQKSKTQAQCLVVNHGVLYACSNENSGFAIGTSTDDGATFTPLLHLGCVRGALTCASADASANQCAADFPALQATLGVCGPTIVDSGAPDGATDASAITPDSGSGNSKDGGGTDGGAPVDPGGGPSSGCSTSGAPASFAVLSILGLAALGLRRRR